MSFNESAQRQLDDDRQINFQTIDPTVLFIKLSELKAEPQKLEQVKEQTQKYVVDQLRKLEASDNQTIEDFFDQFSQIIQLSQVGDFFGMSEPYDSLQIMEAKMEDLLAKNPYADNSFVKKIDTDIEMNLRGMGNFSARKLRRKLMVKYEIDPEKMKIVNNQLELKEKEETWLIEAKQVRANVLLTRITNKKNPSVYAFAPIETLGAKIEEGKFAEIAKEAFENFTQRQETDKITERFDLPKDQKITYIKIFPQQKKARGSKDILESSYHAAVSNEHTLARAYPRMKSLPTIISDTPKQQLINYIQESYIAGGRYFYLDIYNHGTPAGISFEEKLTAQDFMEITNLFPGAKFTINTMACYGGGLKDGFKRGFKADELARKILSLSPLDMDQFERTEDRVSVFLQTRHDTKSLLSFTQKGDAEFIIYQSYFNVFFMQAIRDGKNYGQAFLFADKKMEALLYINAEALIKGEVL